MRHIAIVGMSFCGSTALSFVLGGLKGVANAGETHWIRSALRTGASGPVCGACGADCAVLTQGFFDSLRKDSTNWYEKIAARLQTDTLVTADKDMSILSEFDSACAFDAVYCFRPPLDAYRSYVKSARLPSGMYALALDRYLWYWTNFYGHSHYNFAVSGKKVWVDFAEFVLDPPTQLERLCAKLDLPFSAAALEYWTAPQHSIGGNFSPYDMILDGKGDRLKLAPRTVEPATAEELMALECHPTAASMYRALRTWARE